ncbi:MAG: serine/arginine repetitive matrix protein 2, partial [Anaerotignum sp.]
MKLTRHNGRSGKHGTYNPRHNDRRFDVENSEHIDAERARQNVYWDCYRGFTTHDFRENSEQPDFSFEEIERMYYYEHYADHVNAQNARNEKTRHIERNRTVDDLLKNNKTCPEESIYQIGTMEESVPPETLALIVSEFYEEFENRFGSHIHILDWALHLDEGTPHIHERHVFDCENRYGELCPQQEKALEELGIPLPKPEQPKGKHNNRKQTFDAVCRIILFDVAKRHGLHLEQEPSYGGRDYLEKQDYILMK